RLVSSKSPPTVNPKIRCSHANFLGYGSQLQLGISLALCRPDASSGSTKLPFTVELLHEFTVLLLQFLFPLLVNDGLQTVCVGLAATLVPKVLPALNDIGCVDLELYLTVILHWNVVDGRSGRGAISRNCPDVVSRCSCACVIERNRGTEPVVPDINRVRTVLHLLIR